MSSATETHSDRVAVLPFCSRHGDRVVQDHALRCICARKRVLDLIDDERERQEARHPGDSIASDKPLDAKLRTLLEEVGEVARAIDDYDAAKGAET